MSDDHKMLLATTNGHAACTCHPSGDHPTSAEHAGCQCHADTGQVIRNSAGADAPATDPVCGMTVDSATAPATLTYEGRTLYFCAPGCRRTFEKDPARFATPAH